MKIYYDNGYYVGDVKFSREENGIKYYTREGYGEMHYSNGMKKIGYWKANKMQGHGKIIYPDGDSFEGEFQRGIKHGQGYYKYAVTGNVYLVQMQYDKAISKQFHHKEKAEKVEDIEK